MLNRKLFHDYLWIIGILLYGLSSLYYLSGFSRIGSLEAKLLIPKRAAVIDWHKYSGIKNQKLSEILEPDTFLNYEMRPPGDVVRDAQSRPSVYYKGQNEIWPILVQPKSGSISFVIIRTLAKLLEPAWALIFFAWSCSLIAFIAGVLYVRNSNGSLPGYILFSLLTPQMVYFIGPAHPDFLLAMALVMVCLCGLQLARMKLDFLFFGLLIGFLIFNKLSMVMFLPIFVLLFREKIKQAWIPFFGGLALILLPLLFLLSAFEVNEIVTQDRVLFKSWEFIREAGTLFLFYLSDPGLLFKQIIGDLQPINETLGKYSWLYFIFTSLMFVVPVVILFKHLKKPILPRFLIGFAIYAFVTIALAKEISEDIFTYYAAGIFFFSTVLIAFTDFSTIKNKLTWTCLVMFLCLKVGAFANWNLEFKNATQKLNGCSWTYECLYKEWTADDVLQGKPLITLFYLDVGQFEFYSQGKLIPVHVTWKYLLKPTPEQFEDFLVNFPHSEFYSLWSEGRDLTTYMGGTLNEATERLQKKDLVWEVVKAYDYPELDRSYVLVKFLRRTK